MLGTVLGALAIAYLIFAAIRGWWRICRGPFLEELVDLCRGWKVNVPWWQVPIYFVVFVIVPLLGSGFVLRFLVAWLAGPSH